MSLLDAQVWSSSIFTGQWSSAAGGETAVVEPATGEEIGRIGFAGPDDIARSAARAFEAQRDWARRSYEERAAVLRRAGALWEEHAEEVEGWLVREAGSVPAKAATETHVAAQECFEAAALPSNPTGEILATAQPRLSLARRIPVGVVGVISPFNFPLVLAIRSVAPALALGNAVVLKPDPRTAVCGGVSIARIFEEAGLPEGVLHVLPGDAATGEALVDDPNVAVISFTGSTAAGRKVGEAAARHLKRAHLELGGNSALPVGDPATEEVALGPVIDSGQRDNIHALVTASVDAGARLAAGGTYEELFYQPTVLTDVTTQTPAWAQEIFGPVAPVMRFSDSEEAVKLATDSSYGLVLGILTRNPLKGLELADRIPSGIVHINDQTVNDEAVAPFGGVRDSGTGARFGGPAANVEAFTETQWVTLRSEIPTFPF